MTQPAPVPQHTLNDGSTMPAIGFGTWPLRGPDGIEAMVSALEAGYRLLDSAVNYENEPEVGEAIRRSGVPRDQVVVQTKVPGRDHAYDKALASVQGSLQRLGLEQLDVVLIHWPNPKVGLYHEAWRALVETQRRGWTRSIGVSNFTGEHLQRVIEDTGVTPAINQIELHPLYPQDEMRPIDEGLGVLTQAWSPFGKQTARFDDPAIAGPAAELGVTPAQVVLRWHVQLGTVPLPKSATAQRQRENLDVFGFKLSPAQMAGITAMGRSDGRRFDGDPNVHEEM